LRISLVTPAPAHSRNGNRNTASRWARFLRELGHRVEVVQEWSGARADLMIALHARRSHRSITAYARAFPNRPLVVALTGTDLYRDIKVDGAAQESLELATRLVVLQELGAKELPSRLRARVRTIYQSARAVPRLPPLASCFEVVVSGHLRDEKDPFRAAAALAHVPAQSRVCVTHIGGALSPAFAADAHTWMAREPRYRWLGELPHWRGLRVLARGRLMVLSSRMEGGANVICEALAAGVPVIASRIRGNVGMLGADYPGYFPVGDERALARLLVRAERDREYRNALARSCRLRASLVVPQRERDALEALIAETAETAPLRDSRPRAAA
jgi:putative glycosyltransferase (TIGR04348 family)